MRVGNRSRDEALDIVKELLNNRIVCGDHDGSEFDPAGWPGMWGTGSCEFNSWGRRCGQSSGPMAGAT